MSLLFPIFTIGAAILGAVFSVISAVFYGIANVITWTFTYLAMTVQFFIDLAENRKVAAVLVIGLVVSVLLGPPLVTDANLVLQPTDFIFEGPVRQVTEVYSKLIMINIIGAWDALAPLYNTIVEYFFERAQLWLLDIEDVYNIIAATGDYFQALIGIQDTWNFFKSFVGYFWMTKSPGGKTEFFNEIMDLAGQFFHFPTPAGGSNRYETDPDFGAFPRVDVSGPLYYLRNIVLDLVEVFRTLGDIIFQKIAEFAFPGQKFIPSFYLRISAGDSFWRQLADLLTKVVSLVTGESFFPKEFTVAQVEAQLNPESVQPTRFNKEKYTARILRIIAQLPRIISLIVVHTTTIRFPLPLGAVTGTALELIKIKLIGVPGVDLFLDPALTAVTNPIILSKHLYPCVIIRELTNLNLAAGLLCNAIGDPNIFKQTLPVTDDDIPGSAFNCPIWNGQFTPLENERIDYTFEAFQVVIDIAQLIDDPTGVSTAARNEARQFFFGVIAPILRIIYSYAEYITATVFVPACSPFYSAFNLARFFNLSLIQIIEYFYRPLTCANGALAAPVDPLTCFITINSRASSGIGFWRFLCDVLEVSSELIWRFSDIANFFLPAPQQYVCAKRKRNLASETFDANAAKPNWSYSTYAKLAAMSFSSETRKAMTSAKFCVFSPNSTAAQVCAEQSCSYGPCIESMLDCIADELPKDNRWRRLLDTNNSTTVLFRNTVTFGMNFFDTLRGCSDSFVMRAYKSIQSTNQYVRSFFARWTLLSFDFIPTYFTCMEKLRADTTIVDYNAAFAHCIGLTNRPPPTQERKRTFAEKMGQQEETNATEVAEPEFDWHTTLDDHGVFANTSWCAERLHRVGIVIDDVQIGESLSVEHFAQRICSFQLAFGARARLADTTSHSLPDFIDGWKGPIALLNSMDTFDEDHELSKLADFIPSEMPRLEIRESKLDDELRIAPSAAVTAMVDALQELMPAFDIVSTMFNYYADLHDLVARSDTSPEEKHEMDQRLLMHHLGLREASLQKRSEFRKPQKEYNDQEANQHSSLVYGSSERKRNFANAASNLDSRISVLQEFGNHIYWAGTYPMATAMDQQDEVPFELTINRKLQQYRAEPVVSIRVKRVDPDTGVTLDDSPSQTLWHHLPLSDVGVLIEAMSSELDGNAQQRQLILSAQSAYSMMRSALQPRDQYVQGAWNVQSARAAINYGSIVFTSLARIANRRLRVDGLPSFHAASLFLSILSGRKQELQYFPAWISGQRSYLQGVGFVDNDVYAQYIENAADERDKAISLYSTTRFGESRDVSLLSVRRARIIYAGMQLRLKQKLSMLEMRDDLTGLYARQRATALSKVLKRHSNYAHYASFLVRHELHATDESLHLIAPESWTLRAQAAHANTTTSRQRFNIAASLQAGDFLAAIDEFLTFFGAPPNSLETWLLQLETAVVNFFTSTFDPAFFDNLLMNLWNYLQSVACDVPQDVRRNGTGFYKLLCIPYLDEKAFLWYEFFPWERNKGILGYFEDAGYIHWPPEMIETPCPTQRNPALQCPENPPPPLFLQNPTVVPLEQFETINGQNVTTFPINTTHILGNICFTDWCLVDTTNRPLCPTFDWCLQTYFSPQTFGFTSGFENLAVWANDIRVVYSNIIALDSLTDVRFWAMALLFPVLAFAEFIFVPLFFVTIPAPAAAYLTALAFIIIEIFILQRPEVYILVLIYFWVLLETLPLLAWIQWVPLIVYLYGLHFFGASFLQPLFDFLPNLLPDQLLITIFNFLGSLTFLNFLFDVSFFTDIAASISSLMAQFAASELNNVMAVISFWNVELLVIEIIVIAYFAVYLAGVALYFLSAFLPLFSILTSIASAIANFFMGLMVVNNAEAVGDLEEETVIMREHLQQEMRARDALQEQQIEALQKRL